MAACRPRGYYDAPAARSARARPDGLLAAPAGPHRGRPDGRRLHQRLRAHLPRLRRPSVPGLLRGPAAAAVASRALDVGGGPGRVPQAPGAGFPAGLSAVVGTGQPRTAPSRVECPESTASFWGGALGGAADQPGFGS